MTFLEQSSAYLANNQIKEALAAYYAAAGEAGENLCTAPSEAFSGGVAWSYSFQWPLGFGPSLACSLTDTQVSLFLLLGFVFMVSVLVALYFWQVYTGQVHTGNRIQNKWRPRRSVLFMAGGLLLSLAVVLSLRSYPVTYWAGQWAVLQKKSSIYQDASLQQPGNQHLQEGEVVAVRKVFGATSYQITFHGGTSGWVDQKDVLYEGALP